MAVFGGEPYKRTYFRPFGLIVWVRRAIIASCLLPLVSCELLPASCLRLTGS